MLAFKYLILVFVLILNSQPAAQGKIFFNVKTKLIEKAKLTHIKNATEYKLLKTEWSGVTELGQEYDLWLKNYRKTESGNNISVRLDIEIRRPGYLKAGELIFTKEIEVSFDVHKDYERPEAQNELFRQKFYYLKEKLYLETCLVSDEIVQETFYLAQRLQ
jgi:hypothetical protein